MPLDSRPEPFDEYLSELGLNMSLTQKDIRALAEKDRSRKGELYQVTAYRDDNGEPLMYAINYYDGGYKVVSAFKYYKPVLAESKTGTFNFSTVIPAVQAWIDETAAKIKVSAHNLDANRHELNAMWQTRLGYAPNLSSKRFPMASHGNADITDEELAELSQIVQNCMFELKSQGYEVFDIHGDGTGLDQSQIDIFVKRAEEAIYPKYTDFFEYLSFIVHITEPAEIYGGNRLVTTWEQRNDYNQAFPKVNGSLPPAGCGPVAAGQIMYHYKHPATYAWNAMLPGKATPQTAQLLYDIARKSKYTVTCNSDGYPTGTGVTAPDLADAMKSMGYHAKSMEHDSRKVDAELDNGRFIIMTGRNKDATVGHAWVCAGRQTETYSDYYVCYTLTEKRIMNEIERSPLYTFTASSLYYNWGWGGQYDGFYTAEYPSPGTHKYTQDRQDIVEIYPEK